MYDRLVRQRVFFFQAEDGIRDLTVTGVQTCALPIYASSVYSSMESLISVMVIFRCSSNSRDRKSTRLNSSHSQISYAVFCLKKKKINNLLRDDTLRYALRRHGLLSTALYC